MAGGPSRHQSDIVGSRSANPVPACEDGGVPSFARVMFVGLSVRDVARSSTWYQRLLELEVVRENVRSSAWPSTWDEVLLRHPDSGLLLGLLQHPSNNGDEFSEFNTGLDHIELEVGSLDELKAWVRRLDENEVPHSGIRGDHILTFRDRTTSSWSSSCLMPQTTMSDSPPSRARIALSPDRPSA